MIIECRHIYKTYKTGRIEFPALKDINLEVEEGDYLAVMGPSGSGKSTLMNLIGCLDVPTEGTLLLDGEDIGKCSEDRMSDIRLYKLGFVFQTFHLLPHQTALENVELPLTYAHVPRAARRSRELRSPGQSSTNRRFFWQMSRPVHWIPHRERGSWRFSRNLTGAASLWS